MKHYPNRHATVTQIRNENDKRRSNHNDQFTDCLPVGECYDEHTPPQAPRLYDDTAPLQSFDDDGHQLHHYDTPEPETSQKTLQGDQVDSCGFTVTDICEGTDQQPGQVVEHKPYTEPLQDYDGDNAPEYDPELDEDYFEPDDGLQLYAF